MFEKGNFAGLEEMKRNERLFARVAPMGVNDIMMAVQYRHVPAEPLGVPIIAFDGLLDRTIDAGNLAQWEGYTRAGFRNVPVQGDHYFVSSHYRLVSTVFPIWVIYRAAVTSLSGLDGHRRAKLKV